MNPRGFTLVEVIVAMSLVVTTGAMLTRSIVVVQRSAGVVDAAREAQRLAHEGIEHLRAGHPVPALPAGSRWQRSAVVRADGPGLLRLTVEVEHREDPSLRERLEALAWQP